MTTNITPKKQTSLKPLPPNPTAIPQQQSQIKKIKPKYKYAGKESLAQLIKKTIPKQFIPTNRFATILGLLFLAVITLALVQFPFNKLLSGDIDIVIKVGYPYPFLELGIKNPETSPLRSSNFALDMLIYLTISYLIDIIINFLADLELIKSEEELKKHPRVYKRFNPSIADKITKKVFKK